MTTTNQNGFHRGKLKFVAVFQNNTPVSDGAGGFKSSYSDVLTTRCQLFQEGGNEVLGTGQVYYNQNFVMRCQFDASLTINQDTIVSISGSYFPSAVYKVVNFEKIDMKGHLYEFKLAKS